MKNGGLPAPMPGPGPAAPTWLRLRWGTKLSERPEFVEASLTEEKPAVEPVWATATRSKNLTAKEWEIPKREKTKGATAED